MSRKPQCSHYSSLSRHAPEHKSRFAATVKAGLPLTRRIVAIRAGALGDTVLTLPAIRALRTAYPDTLLEVVGSPSSWELAGPLIDRGVSIDLPMFAGLNGNNPEDLLAWLNGADLVLAWMVRDPASFLAPLTDVRIIHRSPYPPPGVHAARWLIESLPDEARRHATLDVPLLAFGPDEVAAARARLAKMGLDRPVLLHPGAGAAWKRWPAERFAALGRLLADQGHDVVLVEGPADRDVTEAVWRHAKFPVLREPSPRRLAAILGEAAWMVGNDSGVTHLAAAVGTPTLALFGPTDPATWAPLGGVRVLRHCIAQSSVQGEIRVCQDPNCMQRIALDEVAEVLDPR